MNTSNLDEKFFDQFQTTKTLFDSDDLFPVCENCTIIVKCAFYIFPMYGLTRTDREEVLDPAKIPDKAFHAMKNDK